MQLPLRVLNLFEIFGCAPDAVSLTRAAGHYQLTISVARVPYDREEVLLEKLRSLVLVHDASIKRQAVPLTRAMCPAG